MDETGVKAEHGPMCFVTVNGVNTLIYTFDIPTYPLIFDSSNFPPLELPNPQNRSQIQIVKIFHHPQHFFSILLICDSIRNIFL